LEEQDDPPSLELDDWVVEAVVQAEREAGAWIPQHWQINCRHYYL
jgi:hypothetical protein